MGPDRSAETESTPEPPAETGRFIEALSGPGVSGILELKRHSPHDGDLVPFHIDAREQVAKYVAGGAAAVSIQTQERWGGSVDDIYAVRQQDREVPILAKGVYQSLAQLRRVREAGADAALMIMSKRSEDRAKEFYDDGRKLGLEMLPEIHTVDDLKLWKTLGASVAVINNRDLETGEIHYRRALELKPHLPKGTIVIAASGISKPVHVAIYEAAGFDGVLIGTAATQAEDPEEFTRMMFPG